MVRGPEGGQYYSSVAADAERHHHADVRQIQQSTTELASKGIREFLIVDIKGGGLSGA